RLEASQGPDRVAVEGDEREAEGIRGRDPPDVSMTPWQLPGGSSINRTGPFAMRERPINRGPPRANLDRNSGLFLHKATDELLLRSLKRNLPAREGPQTSEQFAGLASDQQDSALRLDQCKGDPDRSDSGPFAGKRDLPFLPRCPGDAESFHRAASHRADSRWLAPPHARAPPACRNRGLPMPRAHRPAAPRRGRGRSGTARGIVRSTERRWPPACAEGGLRRQGFDTDHGSFS